MSNRIRHHWSPPLAVCCLVVTSLGSGAFEEEPVALKNLSIVTVEVHETHLDHLYTGPVRENQYRSGIDGPEFSHGLYISGVRLIGVEYGGTEGISDAFEIGPYPTLELAWQAHGWAVAPPLQPGERVLLAVENHPVHGLLWRSDWRYLMPDHATFARPGTPTYEEDISLLNAIGKVLESEPGDQWRLLHEYGTGGDKRLAIWATEIAIEELRLAPSSTENHQRAAELLRTMTKVPTRLSDAQQGMILHAFANAEATRADWLALIEGLVRGEYQQWDDALQMLAHVRQAATYAVQLDIPATMRARVLELYASALANESIPSQLRVDHMRGLSDSRRRPPGFTDQNAFDVFLQLLRESDESRIELAAAETIRDSLILTPERRAALEAVLEQIETKDAADIIRARLGEN